MLTLAAAKRATGERLGNPVLATEARVTLVDGALAAAVLLGVALNAAAGWWWADPLAALVILAYSVREARHAWGAGSEAVVAVPGADVREQREREREPGAERDGDEQPP